MVNITFQPLHLLWTNSPMVQAGKDAGWAPTFAYTRSTKKSFLHVFDEDASQLPFISWTLAIMWVYKTKPLLKNGHSVKPDSGLSPIYSNQLNYCVRSKILQIILLRYNYSLLSFHTPR
jgi:hypothetical protein